MKRLDADDVYRVANLIVPDGGPLAIFNLIFEVTNGALPYELIDGPADVVEAEDTDIAAAIGLASIGESPVFVDQSFDDDNEDQVDVLKALAGAIKPATAPGLTLNLPRPPFTIAVLIACEGADGRFAYALFRHPGISEAQSRAIVANMFDDASQDDEPTPDGKN